MMLKLAITLMATECLQENVVTDRPILTTEDEVKQVVINGLLKMN